VWLQKSQSGQQPVIFKPHPEHMPGMLLHLNTGLAAAAAGTTAIVNDVMLSLYKVLLPHIPVNEF